MKMSFKVNINDLKTGMILGEDVLCDGNLLLSKGMVVKSNYITKLMSRGVSKLTVLADKRYYDDIFLNPVEKFYAQAYEDIAIIIKKLKEEDELSISLVIPIVEKILEAVFLNPGSILSLTGFRGQGDYNYAHSLDVCIYSLITAKVINLSFEDAVILGMGALLHDIGKVRITDDILLKQDRLSTGEYEQVKKHSEYGYDILRRYPQINYKIMQIVLQHHERCDGSGYPKQLKGKEINMLSKIVAIADIYDALTSDRVYNKKILPHEAAEYLLCISNTLIDSQITKVFINNIAIYPKGCQVLLNTNEVAIVLDSNSKMPLRPLLKIITDRDRNPLIMPYEFDLQKNSRVLITRIFR
ncbi:MAG: HD-GYP domain-containing protein [Ruminiclostridium sp.]